MTYTTKQLAPAIGHVVEVRFESLSIICTITDTKSAYGKVRAKIEPLCGDGSQWVEIERINRVVSASPLVGSHILPTQEAAR